MKAPTIMIPFINDRMDSDDRPCEIAVRDGKLYCADIDAVDYSGAYRGGRPWIAPELVEWATRNGGYWEWENLETIVFTK